MIKIKYIPNRFDTKDIREYTFEYDSSLTLRDYFSQIKSIPSVDLETFDVIVSGKVVDSLDYKPLNYDAVIITPKVEVETIVSFVSYAVSAFGVTSATAIAIANIIVYGTMIAMMAYSIYSGMQQPSMPSFDTNGNGLDEGSPTYGWDGVHMTRDVGIPIPIIYGEHKVGGNVINEYVWTDGDKNYLNMLIALCEGEIESISGIKINDNPVENFSGIEQYTRMGTNNQTAIQHFEDLHNVVSVNVQLLQNSSYVYTTIDDDVEAFEIKFQLPTGLFKQSNTTGEISSWSVTYRVEYKLTTDSTYIDLGTTTISAKSRTTIRRVFRKEGLPAGKYDIRVTKTSVDSDFYHTGDLYLYSIDEINTDDLIYPNTALLGLRLLATDQLSGVSPKVTSIVKGKKVSAPDVRLYADNSVVDWEDYYWDASAGSFKRLSDDATCTWDGTTYVDQYCANPIWCMKDLLTNTRYGLGEYISTLLIDDSQFLEMAKYCDEKVPDGDGGYEKRSTLNVVIDSSTRALDLINQLTATFNAFAFYSAGNVKFSIDKEANPVQVFGMGNIVEGSFNQMWKTIKETPNVIELIFLDKDKDYERETVAIIDEASLSAGNPQRKKSLRVFTTKMTEALRIGRYALKVAQNVNRTVTFKAGIDAIVCQVGDIIDIAHDVPQWGHSGRVVSGTTTSVTLDQSVVIESGKTYKVEVRFADNTIEERTVSNSAGTYTTLNVSSAFSQAPSEYDVYAVGETDVQTKPYRVVSIERSSEFEVMITAIEYVSGVYDDSAVTIPDNNYSALTREIPSVENLSVKEENIVLADGTIGSVADISFNKPTMTSYHLSKYQYAKIFVSDDNGESWTQIGITYNEYFRYEQLLVKGSTYKFAVVSVDSHGNENAIENSPDDSVTILGDLLPPDDVTGFDVSQLGDKLNFEWDANDDADIARYIIKKGSDWASATKIGEVDVTYFSYPVGTIGSVTFLIKAVDTSGNESTNFTSDTINVTPPPEMALQVDHDLFAQNLEFKLTDMSLVKKNLHDSGYVRNCLSLDTAKTWEELEAEGKGWGEAEADGDLYLDGTTVASGSYEMMTPIDLETAFEFKVVLDLDYKNIAGASITTQISYSTDGVTYSAYTDVDPNDTYLGRYIKFKLLFSTSDTSHQVDLYDCLFSIQAPVTTLAWGRDKAVDDTGGITIQYGRTFTFPPRINVTIVNGVEGVAIVNNKTTTSFDVQCKNLSGTGIDTAEIDWDARGY